MKNDLIFVSYSRKEFYFTESLVLHLQRHGINAWFDIQQLEPGIGWKTDIQDGLERCNALVLVVSQSSLNSPYVKAEVEGAQKADKPVYVVLFEPVTLPPELANPAVLIDFTQGFNRGISLLTTIIRDHSKYHDLIPNPASDFLPEGVSALVKLLRQREILWFVLLIGFLIGLLKPIIYFLSGEYQRDTSYALVMGFATSLLIWVLIDVIGGRHLFRMGSKVCRRENIAFQRWVKAIDFRIFAFTSFIFLIIAYVMIFRSFLFLFLIPPLLYIGLRFMLSHTYANRIQVLLNPDVLRWCHLGNEAPFDWRVMVNRAALPEDMEVEIASKVVKHTDSEGNVSISEVVTGVFLSVKGAKPVPKTFRLYSQPQIQEAADNIRLVLKKNSFNELKDDVAEPDYHILLLNPWMPIEPAKNLITEHPNNTLPVMVSPTDLTQLPDITTLQLIDFRRRYEPVLASMLQYLHTENNQHRSVFSIGVLPVRINEAFPLREIRSLNRYVICMASFCFLVGVLGLLGLMTRYSIDLVLGLSFIGYIACFGLGFWFRRIAIDMRNLVSGVGARLKSATMVWALFFVSMFCFELQPQIGQSSPFVSQLGNDFGWRLAAIAFVITLSINVYVERIRAARRGVLLTKPQPMLGIPLTPPPSIFIFMQYFFYMLLSVSLTYGVATAIGGNVAGELVALSQWSIYGSTMLGIVIVGSLSALLTLGIAGSPAFSNDDPVFAVGDAPLLRSYLKDSLHRPAPSV